MQRLPPHRIQRAHEVGEIGFEEDPPASDLGAGNESPLRPRAHLFRVHAKERRRVIEIEGSHGARDVHLDVDLLREGNTDFESAGQGRIILGTCDRTSRLRREDEQRGRATPRNRHR